MSDRARRGWRALLGLLGLVGLLQAALAAEPLRVVYHVNDDDREHQAFALRSIANHLDAEGEDRIEIRVVLHGDGVSMLLAPEAPAHLAGRMRRANADGEMIAMIDVLRGRGVRFEVCGATLARRGIDAEDDLHGVEPGDVVDSGVAELARLQQAGFTYIKP